MEWYTKAAEKGHGISQYDLGLMILLGEGTEKDLAKGLWWLEQAVTNGDHRGAGLLADIYANGHFDSEVNPEKSLHWEKRKHRLPK